MALRTRWEGTWKEWQQFNLTLKKNVEYLLFKNSRSHLYILDTATEFSESHIFSASLNFRENTESLQLHHLPKRN